LISSICSLTRFSPTSTRMIWNTGMMEFKGLCHPSILSPCLFLWYAKKRLPSSSSLTVDRKSLVDWCLDSRCSSGNSLSDTCQDTFMHAFMHLICEHIYSFGNFSIISHQLMMYSNEMYVEKESCTFQDDIYLCMVYILLQEDQAQSCWRFPSSREATSESGIGKSWNIILACVCYILIKSK
jgi:hypothetical protein